MIVLGWCLKSVSLPEFINVTRLADCSMLSAPAPQASTPRLRMEWQLKCFAHGIDFLPIAASQMLTVGEARKNTPDDISQYLAALSGKGQLTLTIASSPPTTDGPLDGRGWLAARREMHQRKSRLHSTVQQIAAEVALPHTTIRQNRTALTFDILVDRVAEGPVKSRIAAAVQKARLDQAAHGAVTGLWPAYGFTQMSQELAL